jgi:uncharacterized membrane protein
MLKLQWLLLAALLLAANVLHAVEPAFIPLPDLNGRTTVHALSANGEVAVGQTGRGAFRWSSATGMEALGENAGIATDVSADGSVVVGNGASINGLPRALRWTADSGIMTLEDVGPFSQTYATGVSSDGEITVGGHHHGATRWTADGRMIGVPIGETYGSSAVALSHDGSIVAGTMVSWTDQHREAVRWSDTRGLVRLGLLPGDTDSHASEMTPDGQVIVGISEHFAAGSGYTSRGFRWTEADGMVELPVFPAGISDDGRVIIGSTRTVGGEPVIWTPETGVINLQPFLTSAGLDLTGWTLTNVTAISGDGTTIAGQGFPPRPTTSGAWIAVIPEPSTWALGGISLLVTLVGMLLRRTWWCRRE